MSSDENNYRLGPAETVTCCNSGRGGGTCSAHRSHFLYSSHMSEHRGHFPKGDIAVAKHGPCVCRLRSHVATLDANKKPAAGKPFPAVLRRCGKCRRRQATICQPGVTKAVPACSSVPNHRIALATPPSQSWGVPQPVGRIPLATFFFLGTGFQVVFLQCFHTSFRASFTVSSPHPVCLFALQPHKAPARDACRVRCVALHMVNVAALVRSKREMLAHGTYMP